MPTEFTKRQLQFLHLEDNENDTLLIQEILRADGFTFECMTVKTRTDFEAALRRRRYDLIISDFSLPSFDGLRALQLARELSPETPFIFFSGTIGEEVAVESLKNGATDYVLKQRPDRLLAAIRNALRSAEERRRRQRVEGELRQMEQRLQIVARATNDVVWEWDLQKNSLWFSENFQAVFGHSPDVIGASRERWLDLIHPDDKARVIASLTALLAGGGRVWWSEHRFRRANGSYAHIYDRASIIYDPARKPLRMVGVSIDETERKQAEEKIREQAALLDKAQDAIILCTLDGEILFWNQGAHRLYGWKAGEVIGKNIRQLLFHDQNPAQLQEVIKSMNETDQWIGELTEFTKDGRSVIVAARPTRIRDAQGRPKSLLIINTDITERKRLEEHFLRAQRFESLGALVGGIAHDLNNALVPITVGVGILREQVQSPELVGFLDAMDTSARRSADMVRQMLTFARGGEASKTIINTSQLVREMGKIITKTFPKDIVCKLNVAADSWPVNGIPTQLYQVLMNLCVNARDAMPNGGTLTVTTENVRLDAADAAQPPGARPGNYLCLTVSDTGTGIPADQLEKIFQPFFTTKAPGKGTGLGLPTSLGIVKNHDGFMTVRSTVNVGTEFKVFLPPAGSLASETPAADKPALPAGHGECILIVDDEQSLLAIMKSTLETYGYKTITAGSGPEAITQLAAGPAAVDLVISDFGMPLMNGPATIIALRKIRPDLKVILASGSEKEVDGVRRTIQARTFLQKPFTTEALLQAVHDALGMAA